jgi:hypothetical protein
MIGLRFSLQKGVQGLGFKGLRVQHVICWERLVC